MYTADEKTEVIRRLDQVGDALMEAVNGLSEAQTKFKPTPEAWSVAEIVEHLAIVEGRILGRVSDLLASALPAPEAKGEDADGVVFERVLDRTRKAMAPDFAHPKGQPLANSLEQFTVTRQRILDLVQSAPPNFRHYSSPHPRFGPLDSHQWLITLAGHCSRHTQQIAETKAAPGFPQG
jgi:hypothetical protein